MQAHQFRRFFRFLILLLRPFRIRAFVGVLMCCALQAEAADRFVRQGASGTGSGSDWTNAYTTLPATLQRGDTYYIADGTYGGYTFDDPAASATYTTIKKATVADHGTNTGWISTYGDGQAIFNGTIRFNSSYWIFDGVSGGGPGSWTSGFGFKVVMTSAQPGLASGSPNNQAGSNLKISHVEVQGNLDNSQGGSFGQDGVAAYGGSFITLSYYYIHDMGRCIFFLSTKDFIAEYGYTGKHVSSSAVHSELASVWDFNVQPERVKFRYNVFTHAEGTGGLILHGSGFDIYGNVFYRRSGDSWQYGNGAIGTWTVSTMTNVKFYNNTLINLTDSSFNSPVFGTLFTAPTTGNEARNNLFYNVANVGSGGIIPAVSRSHNHYVDTTFGSEANKTTGTGDPFLNYTGLDFRLKATAGAGTMLASPYNIDMYGNTRGADGTWDRGAVEFQAGSTSTLAPPTNLRVTGQ